MDGANNPARILVALFGMCFVLLGFCLLIKILVLPLPPLWVSAILMIVGLAMLGPSEPKLQIIFGLVFFGGGTFLALRTIDIITRPWLQYGIGSIFLLGGVALIIYSAIGGVQQSKHPDKYKEPTEN